MRRIESRFMVLVLNDLPQYKLTQGTMMPACNVLTVGTHVWIDSWNTTIQLCRKDIQIFKNDESEPVSQLYLVPNKDVKVDVLGLAFYTGELYAIKRCVPHKKEPVVFLDQSIAPPVCIPETWFTAEMLDGRMVVLRWNDFEIQMIDK